MARPPAAPAALDMWWAWRTRGVLPRRGGWLNQPLSLLAQFGAYEMVYNLHAILSADQEKVDWTKVNITSQQMDVKAWLDDQ